MVYPPPSAMCGNSNSAFEDAGVSETGAIVVIRSAKKGRKDQRRTGRVQFADKRIRHTRCCTLNWIYCREIGRPCRSGHVGIACRIHGNTATVIDPEIIFRIVAAKVR